MIAYVNAYALDGNAAFAVLIDGKTYVYKMAGKTMNAAELLATIFVLKGAPTGDVELHTNNHYALQMLECKKTPDGTAEFGNWFRVPVNNREMIEELRSVVSPAFRFVIDKDSPEMSMVKILARRALGKDVSNSE